MPSQVIPEIGSTWYEDDKRYPAVKRAVRVLAIEDGRATLKRVYSGLVTHAKLTRFGKSRGYKATP